MCWSNETCSWLFSHVLRNYFFMFFILWPHCSCPNGLVTSKMAPAHQHATVVAVYPALLLQMEEIIVTFFAQTLRGHFSWTECPIDLIFCMVISYDLVYWCVKFQEISESPTIQTSPPTQKFQISVAKKYPKKFSEILHELPSKPMTNPE